MWFFFSPRFPQRPRPLLTLVKKKKKVSFNGFSAFTQWDDTSPIYFYTNHCLKAIKVGWEVKHNTTLGILDEREPTHDLISSQLISGWSAWLIRRPWWVNSGCTFFYFCCMVSLNWPILWIKTCANSLCYEITCPVILCISLDNGTPA